MVSQIVYLKIPVTRPVILKTVNNLKYIAQTLLLFLALPLAFPSYKSQNFNESSSNKKGGGGRRRRRRRRKRTKVKTSLKVLQTRKGGEGGKRTTDLHLCVKRKYHAMHAIEITLTPCTNGYGKHSKRFSTCYLPSTCVAHAHNGLWLHACMYFLISYSRVCKSSKCFVT